MDPPCPYYILEYWKDKNLPPLNQWIEDLEHMAYRWQLHINLCLDIWKLFTLV